METQNFRSRDSCSQSLVAKPLRSHSGLERVSFVSGISLSLVYGGSDAKVSAKVVGKFKVSGDSRATFLNR